MPVFGPERYERQKGAPTVYTDTFERCEPSDLALLRVWNGEGKASRITSAEIFVNGEEIFSENAFKQKAAYLEKPISVRKVNELRVVLKSGDFKVPAFLLIEVLGKNCDVTPPVISNPLPRDGALVNTARPEISINYRDSEEGASGIDTDSVRLMVDGHDVTGSAQVGASGIRYTLSSDLSEGDHTAYIAVSDGAANLSEFSWRFTTDTIAPMIGINSHADGVWLNTSNITLGGSYTDERGEVPSFTINGVIAAATADSYRLAVSLAEGPNRFDIIATDPAGNFSTAAITINLDTVAPTLGGAAPVDGALLKNARPMISAAYADETGGSGLNPDTLVFTIDGRHVTADATVDAGGVLYAPADALPEGDHPTVVKISDIAGNRSELRWNFTTDTIPPVIAIDSHSDGAWLNTPDIVMSGSWTDERGEVPGVTINGEGASVSDGRFSLPVSLVEGGNGFTAVATDAAGNSTSSAISINLDTVPPVVTIAAPADDVWVNSLSIPVSGSLSEEFTQVAINGQNADVTGSAFAASAVTLAEEGANPIEVVAVDRAGNRGSAAITVNRDSVPPVVTVTSHGDGDWLNTPTITLGGTLSEAYAEVAINGAAASVVGSTFSLSGIALSEGANSFAVTAVDRAGNSGSASLSLNLDTVPPTVVIDAPPTGSLTRLTTTDIAGHADEPILGAEINAVAAVLDAGNRFGFVDFPLNQEGDNLLTATVKDRAGNSGSAAVTVKRDTIPPQPPLLDALTTPTNVADIIVAGFAEPLSTIRIYGQSAMDSAPQLLAAVPCDESGRFSLGDIFLTEGQSTFSADATDVAGNTGELSASIKVVLDTVPPVITIGAPLDEAWFNTPTVTVSGSVDETLQSLTLNGQSVTLTDLTFSAAAQLPIDGAHNLVVTAVDLAGNSASSAVTVNRDTVAPLVTISAPADGLLTNQAAVDLAGGVNEPVTAVSVNGVAATLVGDAFSLDQIALNEGSNPLVISAVDRAGNSGTATVTVERDSTPPAAPVLEKPPSPTNAAVTALSGSCEAGATVTLTLQQPDGASSTLATLTAEEQGGDGVGAFTLNDIALTAEGSYVLSAIATDGADNSSPAASVSVVRDVTAPVITVTAPLDNSVSEDLEVDIVGSIDDPTAIMTIDGVAVELSATGTFSYPKTLQYGENGIILLATDAAGNSAVAGLTIHADSTPPEITVTVPADGSVTAAGQVTVSGSINEPITALTLGGQPVVFTGTIFSTVATLVEGTNRLELSATDRAGNVGTAAVSVVRDSTPPSLTLTVPEQGAAGTNVQLGLSAADNHSLTLVELSATGTPLWSEAPTATVVNSRDKTLTYTLAPDAEPGSVIAFSARAIDRAGNLGTATGSLTVIAGVAKPGYLQGEVYNDRSGLQLPAATVTVTDVAGTTVATAVTGDDGGYFLELPVGNYQVRLSAVGFTAVDRGVTIASGRNSQVLDARLTPLAFEGLNVDLVGGSITLNPTPDQVEGISATLTVPPEAITDAVDLKLTAFSNQGLATILPNGWSPLGAFELRQYLPATEQEVGPDTFALPVTLDLYWQSGWTLPATGKVALVRYDAVGRRWLATGNATLAATGNAVSAALPGLGQYALIVADDDATTLPAVGTEPSALGNASEVTLLAAVGRVVPSVAPPSVDLRAVGEVVFTRPESQNDPLVSGTVVRGKITERFDLMDGNVVLPSGYTQDLILYRHPCVTSAGAGAVSAVTATVATPELRASFPVTPSRQYSLIELLTGKVGIAVYGVDSEDVSGVMVGTDGARLADADGNVLDIPADALSQTVPVSSRTISGSGALVGDGFTLLRVVAIDLTRQTLASPATLTIPAPENFDATLPVVIALPVESNNAVQMQLVALGRSAGSSIASDGVLAGLQLPGILTSGDYYVLQAEGPLGYLQGQVVNPVGQGYANALVTTSGKGLAAVSAADGGYRLALAAGNHTVSALDPVLEDDGSSSVTIGAATVHNQNITIHPRPPQIVETSPTNGQSDVEPNASIIVTFSEGVNKESVTGGGIDLRDSDGNAVAGAWSFSPDQSVVTFYPGNTLKSEASYRLKLTNAVRDLQGYALTDPQEIAFVIRDITPPVPPPAGAISATFPDEDGYVTVTATQGSAENDVTVLIINNESGAIVGISPEADGSFSARISAQLGDEVEVVLMDEAGNQTTISYLTFKAPDGRYLVTAKGGKVEGEGGSLLEIPEGALVGPAVVKVTQVAEEELPHPVPEEANFIAAFDVDKEGLPFNSEVDLSIPVPADYPEGAFAFLVRPRSEMNSDGSEEAVFEIIDTVKQIDGRLTTASWPFDGIWEAGLYVFLFVDGTIGYNYPIVVYGTAYHDLDGQAGYLKGTDKPVPGAAIRSQGADSYRAYADEEGRYATFGWTVKDVCPQFTVTGIHPLTANRVSHSASTCQAELPQKIDFKLADKDTVIPDATVPEISINLQAVAGQTGKTVLPGGLVNVDKNYKLLITVNDQSLDTNKVTLMSATSSDGTNFGSSNNVTVSEAGAPKQLRREVGENEPPIMQHAFEASFDPTEKKYWRFTVKAIDQSGLENERSIRLRVVDMDNLSDYEGKPIVTVIPDNDTVDISINARISAVFNEPVVNINNENLKLYSCAEKDGKHEQCSIEIATEFYVDISEDQQFRVNLVPKTNLTYNQWYKVSLNENLTADSDIESDVIRDEQVNQNSGGVYLPVDSTVSYFKTKQPRQFELASGSFSGGREIELYNRGDNTYAVIAAGTNGWYVVDTTVPQSPRLIYHKNLTNDGVDWNIRDVAVDPETGLLAMTESIHWDSGNHYGYLRIFDLNAIIAEPNSSHSPVGRQRLSEAYSSLPGRLAVSKGHAFIVSVNGGLQVVDIKAACEEHDDESVAAIVGTYSTNAAGFGNANDIQLYRTGRALLTTNSGYLVMLDVSKPNLPALFVGYKPEGIFFTRVDAVVNYLYAEDEGFDQLIDLAVVGTRDGLLKTIDISNPTVPDVLGTTVDEMGDPISIYVRDISIDKVFGLAYVSTFSAIQVVDIKNPKAPKLLATLTRLPDADGKLLPISDIAAMVQSEGWVFLADVTNGYKSIELVPGLLKHECAEPEEALAGVSRAFCNDYYPALGGKRITLYGRDSDLKPYSSGSGAKVVLANPMSGVTPVNDGAFDDNGHATFIVNLPEAKDLIQLDFELRPPQPVGSLVPPKTSKTSVVLKVRDNSNVTLGEVLDGEAVFVADYYANGRKSVGKYPKDKKISDIPDRDRKFIYFQELLNQVVSRKRNLTAAYTLTDEDGKYGAGCVAAVKVFRDNFKVGNSTAAFESGADGNTTYKAEDNTSAIIRKLSKDYGIRAQGNTQVATWMHKVVDKQTLAGESLKLHGVAQIPDYTIDSGAGLYELYKNVVERYVDAVINNAETFADTAKGSWRYRDGSEQSAVAYSFGAKQNPDKFYETVEAASSSCYAPSSGKSSITLYYTNYAGSVVELSKKYASPIGVAADEKGVVVGSTNKCNRQTGKQFPGLFSWEMYNYIYAAKRSEENPNGGLHYYYYHKTKNPDGTLSDKWTAEQQFKTNTWSGVDCSGFIQRNVIVGKEQWAKDVGIDINVPNFTGVYSYWAIDTGSIGSLSFDCNGVSERCAGAPSSYTDEESAIVYKMKVGELNKLHRADLLFYDLSGIDHVTIMYSSSVEDNKYNVIQAYGHESTTITDEDGNEITFITRKARKNENTEPGMPNPTSFGRIKLWN